MKTSKSEPAIEEHFLLSALPPRQDQTRLAAWIVVVLLAALLATAPFARIVVADTEPFLPAYAAAVLVNDLITAVLLLALFSVHQSRALLALAVGYLFVGLMVVPWALTFPGVFAPSGLLGAGLQTTASIAAVRRVAFPLFVLAYVLLKDADPAIRDARGAASRTICWSVIATVSAAGGLTWLTVAGQGVLPRFMADSMQVSALWQFVPGSAVTLYVASLIILWVRRRSVLDLWLMVVLCTLLIEILLLSYLSSGRLSLGWWAGRFFGLASASVVLLVLLSETTTLYARLVRSASAERLAREARLVTMEALSGSIAHEINQPLASMVTNADAGLRWLEKSSPDLEEVRAALKRIVNDGHRAGKVIESIRTMFRKGPQERVQLNLNELVLDVLRRSQGEAQLGHALVETELDGRLPLVTGNPVQLQQVMSNLITNALDAMGSVDDQTRVLRVTSELDRSGSVLVSVADSGVGLDPQHRHRIFEPFFTTKSHGMGMGLMFCRSIVEAHGGRLWMTDNVPRGAVFQFTLPADDENAPAATGRP